MILVLTDDQGYGDLACHGNPHLRTPHIDGLARDGVEFTNFYVSPVCAPTRSSLLTGRYSLRCGVHGVTRGRECMRTAETTLAEAFRAAGYRTALFGKWHLGEHYPNVPHAQGFEEFIGFRTGHWLNYFDPELERNGQRIRREGFITDILTAEALRFVEQNRTRPFFLYLPYNAPHSPFQVPDANFQRFREQGLPVELASVYAMIENLDDNIGRLLKKLDELGLARDTIFVFLTDNGPAGVRFNAGLRGGKASVYAGGVRVPCFFRCPGRFPAARKIDTLAAHIDLYPTLLDLCGAPRPAGLPIDGLSLRPLLEGGAAQWPDRMLFSHHARPDNPSTPYPGAVRTQRFNLVNGAELYDLASDPGEQDNVAGRFPDQARELRAAYEKWFAEAAAECGFKRPPIPVGYAEENPATLPATQSDFSGALRFHNSKAGFAHDWICDWTSTKDSIWWELDVARGGSYEVALRYACPAADVGARISVEAGGVEASASIREATSMEPVPHRNRTDAASYRDLRWTSLLLGRLKLPQGRTRITLMALAKPGRTVAEVSALTLRRI